MTDIQTYLQNLKTDVENSLVNFQSDYTAVPQSEVQVLADINNILAGGSGGSTNITEAEVTSAIEAADLSAIASELTLADLFASLKDIFYANPTTPNSGVKFLRDIYSNIVAGRIADDGDSGSILGQLNKIKSNSATVTGSASILNGLVIPSTEVTEYSIISFQFTGAWSAQLYIEISNDNTTWLVSAFSTAGQLSTALSQIVSSNGVYTIPKVSRYVRVRANVYSSGTINGSLYLSNIATSNPLLNVLAVDTELPTAIGINDSIGSSNAMPFLASLGLLFNGGSNLVRWRTTSQTTGEGVGRAKVTTSTESINFVASVTTPIAVSSINLGSVYSQATAQLIINSGTLTAISWKLEGSFNNTNWFDLESSTSIVNGTAIHSQGKLFQYLRINILSMTGTSPNIGFIGGAY
jgi:hypothetical protein